MKQKQGKGLKILTPKQNLQDHNKLEDFAMLLGNKNNKIKEKTEYLVFSKKINEQKMKHQATNGNFATQLKGASDIVKCHKYFSCLVVQYSFYGIFYKNIHFTRFVA